MRDPLLLLCGLGPLAALLATGCASLECGEGTFESEGVCVVDSVEITDPETMEEVLDEVLTCEPQAAGAPGELDLEAGCIGAACATDSFAEFVERMQTEPSCAEYSTQLIRCDFPAGVQVQVRRSTDDPSAPDPSARLNELRLVEGSPYRSPEGLGVGTDMGCFVEELGYPEIATLGPSEDGFEKRIS